jgi:hypothetical protein
VAFSDKSPRYRLLIAIYVGIALFAIYYYLEYGLTYD